MYQIFGMVYIRNKLNLAKNGGSKMGSSLQIGPSKIQSLYIFKLETWSFQGKQI